MVSKTKQGTALKAAFADFVELVRAMPGVLAAVASEDPIPAITTFIEKPDMELYGDIGEAEGTIVRAHLDIAPEFRTISLHGASLARFAIDEDDLVYQRAVDGN